MKLVGLVALLTACGNPVQHNVDAHVTDVAHPDAPRDAAIDAPSTAKYGVVEVAQGTGDGTADASATATFGSLSYGVTVGTDGPCTIYDPSSPGDLFSAGTISITGTAAAITMTPGGQAPDVHYSTNGVPKPAFTSGATITVTGAGGPDVGAFSASVVAPAALAGYTPPTTISRQGYTATWTAGAGPTIWVIMGALDVSGGAQRIVICRVTDTGSFTIPASTFAMIPAANTSGLVGVGRVSPMTQTVNGVAITVQATSYITSGEITIGS